MMLKFVRKLFSNTLYVQLWQDRIRIVNTDTQASFDEVPYIALRSPDTKQKIISAVGNEALKLKNDSRFVVTNPFAHPRILISDFVLADKVLRYGFHQVQQIRFIPPSPLVVLHPMEKLEGGITQVEVRALQEIALSAGAREARVHVGNPLSTAEFNLAHVCEPQDA